MSISNRCMADNVKWIFFSGTFYSKKRGLCIKCLLKSTIISHALNFIFIYELFIFQDN